MTQRDDSPLSFLTERLLGALRDAGDEGLSPEAQDGLNIPQLEWRVNELHRAGFVVGELDGVLFLVHDATSTGAPVSTASAPPAGPSSDGAGAPVDAAPSLFDPASTAVSGPGGCSLSPGADPGTAGGAVLPARRRPLRVAA